MISILLILLILCAAPVVAQTDTIALPDTVRLDEASVRIKKERYRRKDNPAVELMRRVIAAKNQHDWTQRHDYTSVEQYSKTTLSLNEVSPRLLQAKSDRRLPHLHEQVEVCNATGKLIMPLSMSETVTQHITRSQPASAKDIVLARRHTGVEDLFDVGTIATQGLEDLFAEVNVMDDDIRLFQHQMTSPLSSRTAISFYHYHIADTLTVDGLTFYDVFFTPANPQDFGFQGSMLIAADSTYQVLRASLSLPRNTGVNWVESLRITQGFATLPTGETVLTSDDMVLELRIMESLQKFLVQRTTRYTRHSTERIPSRMFRQQGREVIDPNAEQRTPDYWRTHRSQPLTSGEQSIDQFKMRFLEARGLKPVVWLLRALATNAVPLAVRPGRPSYVDITPVNTIISSNPVDGLRLRLSARTTAELMPHLFLKGYVAYGFRDRKWKGLGEVTYAFNSPLHSPQEFPVHNLSLTYQRDLMAPSDRFLNTDKDNVFTSLKWAKTEHMMYFEQWRLRYEREWKNGLRLAAHLRRQEDRPAGQLRFAPLSADASQPMADLGSITYSEASLTLAYRPGARYINSKQTRHTLNNDAPLYSLTHTMGLRGPLGGQYKYNLTEAQIYRRLHLNSWGTLDIDARGGIQWNRVPFPLLIMPAANLSFIKQRGTFELINNMEFLNDRYASLILDWDLQGKLLNRIPLLRRLKWREYLGLRMLWGTCQAGEAFLVFPENSHIMSPRRPYIEASVGLHNILRVLHVEYVHRFTYNELSTSPRWGIRLRLNLQF